MEKAAKRQRPSISANPREQSEYITVFKNERRERLDVHKQIEYHLRDKVIAEVPHEFLDDAHLFNLWRPLSLNTELGVLQKEAGRIDEFHNMLADIRAKYPRGDNQSKRSKHFQIRTELLRVYTELGRLHVFKVNTDRNISDMHTKALLNDKFTEMRDIMMGTKADLNLLHYS